MGPSGGLYAARRLRGRWAWSGRATRVCAPVRCQRHQWYLVRARLAETATAGRSLLQVTFLRDDVVVARQCVWLWGNPTTGGSGFPAFELLGWFETPADATHLRLELPATPEPGPITALTMHPVAERDPKCHPLAAVPRWNAYRPPFPLERVVLPASLETLVGCLAGVETQVVREPASAAQLAALARRAACVLEPDWVDRLGLTLGDLARIAAQSWLLVDLATFARLVAQTGTTVAQVVTHRSEHGLMSARVEYADAPTRGFALQDVLPYSTADERRRFAVRGIRSSRAWRRYADAEGFATLLAAETPWEREHGDVLSAIRAVDGGELLVTDLPWLVAGQLGPALAPRLAAHLLRMHLGLPLADHLQYWNRWGAGDVLVRDIADMPLRFPELRTARWAATGGGLARLGLTLPAFHGPPRRHVLIQTGRIDRADAHDGLPAEPMLIFMKWLAREARENTPWARRCLADQTVTWQFDTREGLKYVVEFDAAATLPAACTTAVSAVTLPRPVDDCTAHRAVAPAIAFENDEGLHGDGSLEFQDKLVARLRSVIEAGAEL